MLVPERDVVFACRLGQRLLWVEITELWEMIGGRGERRRIIGWGVKSRGLVIYTFNLLSCNESVLFQIR